MKDINAIYDFKNGDYIIKQLKLLTQSKVIPKIKKILSEKAFINLNNAHADVFELTVYNDLNIEEIIKIKDIIFNTILGHNFKLLKNKSTININITIGCSKADDNMIKIYAEKALHNAKLNFVHYSYYDSYFYKNENTNKNILDILNYNIENNLVEPYFQAIMDNESEQVVKYEALMRLYDKKGHVILPHVFIQKSKKARLYSKLMEQLIDKVVKYIITYKIHVSINLDYTDILNPHIKYSLKSKIKTYNIGEYLTLEILESEKITNFSVVNSFIDDMRKQGVKIAIDDFGSGFSNYEYILNLNIDYIKIDGSLIKKIDTEIYFNLIKSIVLFCKQHNIEVIAEFVSELSTFRYVKSIGIDYSQGYYVDKPRTINELIGDKK